MLQPHGSSSGQHMPYRHLPVRWEIAHPSFERVRGIGGNRRVFFKYFKRRDDIGFNSHNCVQFHLCDVLFRFSIFFHRTFSENGCQRIPLSQRLTGNDASFFQARNDIVTYYPAMILAFFSRSSRLEVDSRRNTPATVATPDPATPNPAHYLLLSIRQ